MIFQMINHLMDTVMDMEIPTAMDIMLIIKAKKLSHGGKK